MYENPSDPSAEPRPETQPEEHPAPEPRPEPQPQTPPAAAPNWEAESTSEAGAAEAPAVYAPPVFGHPPAATLPPPPPPPPPPAANPVWGAGNSWEAPAPAPVPAVVPARRGPGWAMLVVAVLISAIVSAAVSSGVVAGRLGARLNGVGLPVSTGTGGTTNISISEDSMAVDVASHAAPSVVTILTQELSAFNQSQQGIGSGFFVTSDGYIVTNRHVVAGASRLQVVRPNDSQRYDAKVVGTDPGSDIAVLKIDGSNFPPLKFGDSSALKVGQRVVAIGSPLGEQNTVTQGIVSALHRNIDVGDPSNANAQEQLFNVVQTDASINPGNSGGPLLDSLSEVIGVNVAASSSGHNIGFSVDANTARASADQLMRTGRVVKPYIGISYRPLTSQEAAASNLPEGAEIADVVSGSPADHAGLKPNDVIVNFGGDAVTEANPLAALLRKHQPGEKVNVTISRGGRHQDVQLTLGENSPT